MRGIVVCRSELYSAGGCLGAPLLSSVVRLGCSVAVKNISKRREETQLVLACKGLIDN